MSFIFFLFPIPWRGLNEQLGGALLLAGFKPQQKGMIAAKAGFFKTVIIRERYISYSLFARFSLPIQDTCSDPQLICWSLIQLTLDGHVPSGNGALQLCTTGPPGIQLKCCEYTSCSRDVSRAPQNMPCSAGILCSACLEACCAAVWSDERSRQDEHNSSHVLIAPQLLVGNCWQALTNCCFNILEFCASLITAFSYT